MTTLSPPDQLSKHLISIDVNKVQMRQQQSTENQQVVEELLNELISAMKILDDLFKDLYQHKVYAGSYWDGLRVKSATEFNVFMVLRLPFKSKDVKTIPPTSAPAYLQYQLSGSIPDLLACNNPKWTFQQKLVDFFDNARLLKRTEVQRWLQELITKAMNSVYFQKHRHIKMIRPSQSGPTYHITTIFGVTIDVDLIPVIDGSCYPIPTVIYKSARFNQLKADQKNLWFMVPKLYLTTGANKPDTYWKITFTEAEKKLLPTDGYLKTLIKLLKLLRDTQNWDKIASYYIKTLFLHELDNNPDLMNWTQDQIGTQFMMMLNKLKSVLENKQLSYYFVRSANLLADMDRSTASKYAHRIEKIIKDIRVKPELINSYFE